MNQKYDGTSFKQEFMEQEDDVEDDEIRIIRSKKFAIKPMDVEEACVQMELLGHDFFVFRNADTFEVNVVYKRKGNTYGLIEPEFLEDRKIGGDPYDKDLLFFILFL